MAGSLLQVPKTPYYIDDASCRCSLRDVKATSSNHGKRVYHAWSCVGEVKDISMGTTGKWFLTEHETHPEDLNQTGSWAGNPPNLDRTYVYSHNENGTKRFVPLDPNGNTQPSISDTACTGRNDTKQSTLLYRQMNDLKEGLPAHLGCNMDNATPIFIQNASSWHEKGCNLGFMCGFTIGVPERFLEPSLTHPE